MFESSKPDSLDMGLGYQYSSDAWARNSKVGSSESFEPFAVGWVAVDSCVAEFRVLKVNPSVGVKPQPAEGNWLLAVDSFAAAVVVAVAAAIVVADAVGAAAAAAAKADFVGAATVAAGLTEHSFPALI